MVNEEILQEIRLFLDRVLARGPIQNKGEYLFAADMIVAEVAKRLMAQTSADELTWWDLYSQGPKGPGGPHYTRVELLVEFAGAAFGEVKPSL